MIRASWNGALLAALVSAGAAWGQPASLPKGTAQPAPRIVTLRQNGGLPEPCRILKTWTTEKGRPAWLLQSIDSDEMLTVVQKDGTKAGVTEVRTEIYRWSNSLLPPPGSPVPPRDNADTTRLASRSTAAPVLQLPPPTELAPARDKTDPIRQVSHTTAAPPAQVPSTPTSVTTTTTVPGPVASSGDGCAAGPCETVGTHCRYVHRQEIPASLSFQPGNCLPVCAPSHSPTYGYYPTQWRPWPGAVEADTPQHDMPPAMATSPAPHSTKVTAPVPVP